MARELTTQEKEKLVNEIDAKLCIEAFLKSLQGRFSPDEQARALEGILSDICLDEYQRSDVGAAWSQYYVPQVAYNFFKLEEEINKIEDEKIREIAGGDAGNSYQ